MVNNLPVLVIAGITYCGIFIENPESMTTAIKETALTPSVRVLYHEHRIVISGHSRLADPGPFYEELTIVLNDSLLEFKTHVSIDFILEYMNSSSSKWLFHLLKDLQKKFQGIKLITINWFCDPDDESMLEAGEVFQSLLTIPFNIVETNR